MSNNALQKKIQESAEKSRFLLIGDTNHEHSSISESIFNPRTLDSLKSAGHYKIGIEYPIGAQPAIDAFADGKIRQDQFVSLITSALKSSNVMDSEKDAELMANFIVSARQRNQRIYAVDGMEGDSSALLQNEIMRRVFSRLATDCQGNPDLIVTKNFYIQTEESVENEMNTDGSSLKLNFSGLKKKDRPLVAQGDGFYWRMQLDTPILAQRIFEISDGQPMTVIYGFAHMLKENDLDEALGKLSSGDAQKSQKSQDVSVINVHRRRDDYQTLSWAVDFCSSFNCSANPKHMNFYLADSSIELGNVGLKPLPITPDP